MALRILVVLQAPADTAETINETQQVRDSQCGMVERLPSKWVRNLARRIHTPIRKIRMPAGFRPAEAKVLDSVFSFVRQTPFRWVTSSAV